MSLPKELLAIADELSLADSIDFSLASLRRSISTSYYAAFSAISHLIADSFTPERDSPAWRRVFRALNHAAFEKAARLNPKTEKTAISGRIAIVLNLLISLHDRRITADHDPHYEVSKEDAPGAFEDACEVVSLREIIDETYPAVSIELSSLCLFPSERQR